MANLTEFGAFEGEERKRIQKLIIQFRKGKNYTQQNIADKLNIPRSSYAYYECLAKRLSTQFVEKVAIALGTNYYTLCNSKLNSIPKSRFRDSRLQFVSRTTIFDITTSHAEQTLIKKLRCLPQSIREDIYKQVDEIYKETKVKDLNK